MYAISHATKKVPCLKLSINNTPIEKVEHFNFLGLTLDTNLKWNDHVQKVSCKISQITGVLRKLQTSFPQRILMTIYSSLIESHMSYCLPVWGTNNDRITTLQKKAIRVISFSNNNSHTSPLFKSLGYLTFQDMFHFHLLKLYYKFKYFDIPTYFNTYLETQNKSTRENERYQFRHKRVNLPITRREFITRNAKYQLQKLIVNFDEQFLMVVEKHNFMQYKRKLKQYFIDKYESNCTKVYCYTCGH